MSSSNKRNAKDEPHYDRLVLNNTEGKTKKFMTVNENMISIHSK